VAERRALVPELQQEYGFSERQACRLVNVSRSVYRYQPRPSENTELSQALHEVTRQPRRWGQDKIIDYFQQQRQPWNHKRIQRVYRQLGLNLRVKPKKRLPAREPRPLVAPLAANQSWSLDFMSDSLSTGRAFRTLNIIDDFNREALWIEVDTALPAERVIRVLNELCGERGHPTQLRLDNGPEFMAHALAQWASEQHVVLAHIQPGKPAQNAYIERFNRTYREDVLDAYLFQSLDEVREITEDWLVDYNTWRPHAALEGLTPFQYAQLQA